MTERGKKTRPGAGRHSSLAARRSQEQPPAGAGGGSQVFVGRASPLAFLSFPRTRESTILQPQKTQRRTEVKYL